MRIAVCICLGKEFVRVLETPGHTDCSLTYVLEPAGIMFASESTGVLKNPRQMHTAILKSYGDSMRSAEKCRAYEPKRILSPHFGMVPQWFNDIYWRLFIEEAEEKRLFFRRLYLEGLTEEQMLECYDAEYWEDKRAKEQPKDAFLINGKNMIKVLMKEFKKEDEGKA